MSVILNIETSGTTCSVALSQDGTLIEQRIETAGMKHAELLAPYVEDMLTVAKRKELTLNAVAVSIGPGSYTGLRIGLSTAKGLCYGLNIPMITVSSLEILAVKAMFLNRIWEGDELIVPMIDARRMEVYTAAYNFHLDAVIPPQAMIITPDSFAGLKDKKLILCGSGSNKTKEILADNPNMDWANDSEATAYDMIALSEKMFREGKFADVAYCTPEYIKSFRTTAPRNKLF